jgi:hypothetical protein
MSVPLNFLQLALSLVYPLTPSIVFAVQADIKAIPSGLFPLTCVPNSAKTTVLPPVPVAPVAPLNKDS